MNEIDKLLGTTSHRPWDLPIGSWRYYQEWNDTLFLHWNVPASELIKVIPKGLPLDTFNGEGWISLVAFTMERTKQGTFHQFQQSLTFMKLMLELILIRIIRVAFTF